jgi:hypothetical protein
MHRLLVLILLLSGCYPWFDLHPDRRDFNIDGITVSVVPQPDGYYANIRPENPFASYSDPIRHRNAQLKAVELYTGCPVSDHVTVGFIRLVAQVKC